MPSAQSDSVCERFRRRDFDDLHREVCSDQTRDDRFTGNVSNAQKTRYICIVLDYPENAFDLDVPFPIEDWMATDNNGLINAGLYISDLRVQFYGAVLRHTRAKGGPVWVKHADAEFWRDAFNAQSHMRMFGALIEDEREIN